MNNSLNQHLYFLISLIILKSFHKGMGFIYLFLSFFVFFFKQLTWAPEEFVLSIWA